MEAITIAGLAVVAVGGYYSIIDLINDLGIGGRCERPETKRLPISQHNIIAQQRGVKKMAGMHV